MWPGLSVLKYSNDADDVVDDDDVDDADDAGECDGWWRW